MVSQNFQSQQSQFKSGPRPPAYLRRATRNARHDRYVMTDRQLTVLRSYGYNGPPWLLRYEAAQLIRDYQARKRGGYR